MFKVEVVNSLQTRFGPSKYTYKEKRKRKKRSFKTQPQIKKKKNYAHTLYRRECEPVIQMLNTAGRVVAWGVIPLWEVGSISKKVSLRQKS
jgi:abortive infection bacteriophage resistance protein